MDKLFDSYWALRVIALILAVTLFFYAKAQLDEGQTSESDTNVDIITDVPLEAYYDTENLIVSGLPETVDVTIEGPMPIVIQTKLTKDFKVFVDLSTLLIGEHSVTIQHENFSPKLDVTIDPGVLDLVIEEKVTKEIPVEPEINNSLIAEGYELMGMTSDPSTILVTGAKSVIESIGYVKATVNSEEGITASFNQEANVKVLDSSLNKLDVTIEPETVNVSVDVKQYSRKVPLTIRQTGNPMEGVTINRISSETKVIEIFGPKSIIDPITGLEVEFDISEIQKSGVYEVEIPLPNGVSKLSRYSIEVQANVTKRADNQTEDEVVQEPGQEEEQGQGQQQPEQEQEQEVGPVETEPEEETNNVEETPPVEEETPAEEDNNTE
ncbi:CdaR family protein [Ureibacillus aquaedulcis]|uniref:CdaR family protein n=1 Tax=Ureibacillus aquaedulcis TaxID=3058421 RepID=A0ABT8GUZ2_9BACL|nr:CdaR family protein [Ureibacillus sp. BA0131]MDN4495233.1 CdaR family protein [Ureibacillus sp. BA0131]